MIDSLRGRLLQKTGSPGHTSCVALSKLLNPSWSQSLS